MTKRDAFIKSFTEFQTKTGFCDQSKLHTYVLLFAVEVYRNQTWNVFDLIGLIYDEMQKNPKLKLLGNDILNDRAPGYKGLFGEKSIELLAGIIQEESSRTNKVKSLIAACRAPGGGRRI